MLDVFLASQHVPGITHQCHLAGAAQRLWEEASAPACCCRRLHPVLRKSRPPDSWPPSNLLGLQWGPAFTPIARLHGFSPREEGHRGRNGGPSGSLTSSFQGFALREGQGFSPVHSVESQGFCSFRAPCARLLPALPRAGLWKNSARDGCPKTMPRPLCLLLQWSFLEFHRFR